MHTQYSNSHLLQKGNFFNVDAPEPIGYKEEVTLREKLSMMLEDIVAGFLHLLTGRK